jgi:DNA repair exonuclease SbcCD ATPase subunit
MWKAFLEELLIERFTAHRDRKITFGKPVTIAVGPNASGKTSIKDAVEWLLTGACRSTDAGGRGYESLIMTGEQTMAVSAQIGGEKACRFANAKGVEFSVEGWQGGRKTLEAEFYKKISDGKGLTKGQIHALMNSTYFFTLSAAEQKDMLFAALGLDFGKAELPEMVGGVAMRPGAFPMALADILQPIPEVKRGAKLLAAVYDAGFAERREAKRTLKTLTDQADDRPDAELPAGIETSDLGAAQEQLLALRAKRDELLRKRDAIRDVHADRLSLASEIKALEERHAELEGQIADPTKMVKALKVPDLTDEKTRIEAKREEVTKVGTELVICNSEIGRLTNIVTQLEANAGHCVLASNITCPHTGKGTKIFAALHEALVDAQTSKGTLEAAKAVALKGLAAMTDDLTAQESGLRQRTGLESKITAITATRDEVANQIEAKAHKLGQMLKAEKPVPDALVAEIEGLEGRIVKGEALVDALIRREEVEKHIKARKAQIGSAEARVAVLETMVQVFGPEGIVVSMLAERRDALLGPMVAAVKSLTAGEYELSFADDLSVRVKHGVKDLPVESLSSSERLRIGIGVQVGLARALSFPLVVIDNADMLDPDNKELFAKGLMALAAEGLQVIVLATAEKPEDADGSASVQYVELRVERPVAVAE